MEDSFAYVIWKDYRVRCVDTRVQSILCPSLIHTLVMCFVRLDRVAFHRPPCSIWTDKSNSAWHAADRNWRAFHTVCTRSLAFMLCDIVERYFRVNFRFDEHRIRMRRCLFGLDGYFTGLNYSTFSFSLEKAYSDDTSQVAVTTRHAISRPILANSDASSKCACSWRSPEKQPYFHLKSILQNIKNRSVSHRHIEALETPCSLIETCISNDDTVRAWLKSSSMISHSTCHTQTLFVRHIWFDAVSHSDGSTAKIKKHFAFVQPEPIDDIRVLHCCAAFMNAE